MPGPRLLVRGEGPHPTEPEAASWPRQGAKPPPPLPYPFTLA